MSNIINIESKKKESYQLEETGSLELVNSSERRNFNEYSMFPEITRLAVKIDFLKKNKKSQIVLITSSVGQEGKSTISSLVARSIARNSKKYTLLIDFDIRRPTIHKIFNVHRNPGLTWILMSKIPYTLALKQTNVPNLMVLTGGEATSNPTEIMKTEILDDLFKQFRTYFEYIIIDSPPVIPVTDPLIFAKYADDILFVVKAGSTSRHVIQRALDMFHSINVKISGIVLNNMANVLPHYYDSRYYNKYYNYYYNSVDKGELPNNAEKGNQLLKKKKMAS